METLTLPNGLRVVLSPDRDASVVGVAVVYDVGCRSEPEDRTGFAHLFEHMMFQGSRNFEKLAHAHLVQGMGGSFNGKTHLDHTDFYQTLPSYGLDQVLALEADRMHHPLLNEENLRNQASVVSEEIRTNVLSQPYGGFPRVQLAPVLFDTFANQHDGYGSFEHIEAATIEDARDFFGRFYAPANAVLSVVGDFRVEDAQRLVERHFGDIAGRPTGAPAVLAEHDLTCERRSSCPAPRAQLVAYASGWRVPDPVGQLHDYLPYLVLASVLARGKSSRLPARLVTRDRLVLDVGCRLGFADDPFGVRDPTALVITAVLAPGRDMQEALLATEEELDHLATSGVAADELANAQSTLCARQMQSLDSVTRRGLRMAVFHQQRGDGNLINDLPGLIREVTADEVAAAASTLTACRRATVELIPPGVEG